MTKILSILFAITALGCSHGSKAPAYTDEPEGKAEARPFKDAPSYQEALQVWKSPEDVNDWIAARFSYDMDRAIKLSETQKQKGASFPIKEPKEFFEAPQGVCVDLSRFGVETLKKIAPETDAKYLMIKFDPIQVRGNTLRLHWMTVFKKDGKYYFFADSKRPGVMLGPYDTIEAFIDEYSKYRGRKIDEFKKLDSYLKKRVRKKS